MTRVTLVFTVPPPFIPLMSAIIIAVLPLTSVMTSTLRGPRSRTIIISTRPRSSMPSMWTLRFFLTQSSLITFSIMGFTPPPIAISPAASFIIRIITMATIFIIPLMAIPPFLIGSM